MKKLFGKNITSLTSDQQIIPRYSLTSEELIFSFKKASASNTFGQNTYRIANSFFS